MNITDEKMWVEESEIPEILSRPTDQSFKNLFAIRQETFEGFAKIENGRGFLDVNASLSSAKGQEMARILFMRCIEELAEAADSKDPDHLREELVDAINYAWTVALLDPEKPNVFYQNLSSHYAHLSKSEPTPTFYYPASFIGLSVLDLSPVLEKLRNRAWMNRSQSLSFEGWNELTVFLARLTRSIVCQFDDWTQFVQFFLSKDNVLQFRLRTQY